MTKMKKLVGETCAVPEKKISTPKAVLVAGALLVWMLTSKGAMAQTKDSSAIDTSKIVPTVAAKPAVEAKSWVFFMDPTYSPTDKIATVRLSWGWSVHGIKAWWFLDLSGKELKDWVSSTFWKFTLSKSTDSIIKGTWVAVEFTLFWDAPDKVRTWFLYAHKVADWTVVFKVYPFSEKWFEPFALLAIDQKLWKKLIASAFVWSDLKSKSYYGEAEITGKITKQISALLQTRIWGKYDSKPKAWVYVGARVKF